MSSPNSWAKATVQNEWGMTISIVNLKHRYDKDHYDENSWTSIENGQSGEPFDVGFWTGFGRTGRDYWKISFEADGKIWTCKDNFYCSLKENDKNGLVKCRVYKDGNQGKMEVVCPTSSNCTVSLTSRSKPLLNTRPIYIIGHRCNDPGDIGLAISSGCNALECDLQYEGKSKEVFVNHDVEAGTTLSEWLNNAKLIMRQHPSNFSLIIFDCKFAASHDSETTNEALTRVKQAIRNYLNKGENMPINVLFSIAEYKNRGGFYNFMNDLQFNEGIAFDQNNDPNEIENFFKDNAIRNGWYGDGIATISPIDVFPSIRKGADLRDQNGIIKKIYVWTLAKKDSIRKFIEEGSVDGVMVNVPGTVPLSPFGLEEALEVVSESGVVHLAKRYNPAFTVYKLHDGSYQITSQHSGKCLDLDLSKGPDSVNGTNVHQWDWHGGNNQKWILTPQADGSYQITSQHSGKCLDLDLSKGPDSVNGTNVQQWDWHGGNNQKWILIA